MLVTDDPTEKSEPRLRRFLWSPWTAMVVPIFFAARILAAGFGTRRAIGLGWGLVYLVLTLANRWTRGRVLRWMYDKEAHVRHSEQLEESAKQLVESRRQQEASKRQQDEYERWHQETRKQYEAQLARTNRLTEAEEENVRRGSALLEQAERLAGRFEALIARWEAAKP